MNDFALVTEGPTDQVILKNILLGYFHGQPVEPSIYREHPDPQAAVAFGGWTLLLNYLQAKKFRQALQLNRFLIVQIDTDVSEDRGFDVPKQDANGPLSVEAMVASVIERLKSEIGVEDWAIYGDKFIFAIAVHQTECWALPLWENEAGKAGKTENCLNALGQALRRNNLPWVQEGNKDVRIYDTATRGYRKRRDLLQLGPKNPSLKILLDELNRRNIELLADA